MDLNNVMDIAGSAMSAQSVRLNTTASNLANADSISSSINQTYKARHPVFSAIQQALNADGVAGVQVKGIVESSAPVRPLYQPDHPLANADGYIFQPNVNLVEEMADMISASRAYQTNVQVANTAKQMLARTLQLGQ
ncbi:flagellar basal body rod protein FlgC [Permianibacter sp. IMCC34836]|uniref:flagellar basal body rod protein FlgC n=1 Tax=Permianibacter fluminis TaxID=2738515 RepID=UPI001551D8C5|nr:flagellar basal body rod protein FlgC [Permianibacter fluminis]NQD38071.1 flagellar basal body rod protein FlgC [Permianibacter fluminis]